MDDDEAALLAELRAISNKSAASRFVEDDGESPEAPLSEGEDRSPSNNDRTDVQFISSIDDDDDDEEPNLDELLDDDFDEDDLTNNNNNDYYTETTVDDVFHDAPKSPEVLTPLEDSIKIYGGAGNFKQETNFQGERGGAAEDAELLALLRGVSAQSKSADRFADDDHSDPSPPPTSSYNKMSTEKPSQKGRTFGSSKDDGEGGERRKAVPAPKSKAALPAESTIVSAPVPQTTIATEDRMQSTAAEVIMGGGGNFKQQTTFAGERGGAAEDAELLALLRGVSANSSSAGRFGDDNDVDAPNVPLAERETKPPLRSSVKSELPPWKRGKATSTGATVAVEVEQAVVFPAPKAAPAPALSPLDTVIGGGGNFKQESTFSGERGGAAEDEELLALLRGVSAKSGGADRFAEEGTAPVQALTPVLADTKSPKPDLTPHDAIPAGAGNFKQESTFQGERGGAAVDEELLALLRGVSARAGGVDRFAGDGEAPSMVVTELTPNKTVAPSIATSADADGDIEVTRDNLLEYITSSDWKARRDSYILLRTLISESSNGKEPTGAIASETILSGLDNKIASFLMDKNATALEEALHLASVYADYCVEGQSAELAESVAVNLIKGGAFTSSRPKAIKGSQALALKLMEVGKDVASINAVIGVLLDQGLSSKMPKIVQMSTSLILEAAQSFGAACLPLAAIKHSLPKMLSHSNKKIRDVALELLAELCRALGGKTALAAVIEDMKKPQLKDLDILLAKQRQPSVIKIGLRSRRSINGPAPSAEDAMAALQAGNAKLEAERFAMRPAVNLPEEVLKSEYSQHLKLPKWSEKVAGLEIILACAGEKPYKLVQPSMDANYSPLIGEMKGLLPHTHFAVVTKALEVLAMMAEGAGERLYPHLRPLLPKFFALSKDKKLKKPVASCLDALFGNVLSFDHILDADSAIPSATSERTEKNALSRSMALDFLGRCVARRGEAGSRSALTASSAKLAAQVASEKLGDSDASVRAAALEVLKELQKVEDLESKRALKPVIDGLETSNPRAFKQLGRSSVPPTAGAIPRPAPPVSPAKATVTSSVALVGKDSPAKHTKKSSVEILQMSRPIKTAAGQHALQRPPAAMPPDVSVNISNDEAAEYVASLGIPEWDAQVDDGGVLAGLLSTKWLHRQNAIKGIASFICDREFSPTPGACQKDTSCILIFVKEHTRGFNETNVQVAKSILELLLSICDVHEKKGCPLPTWVAREITNMTCSKMADKKLSPLAKILLLSACVVSVPRVIMGQAYESIANVKSPLAQEEFLFWMKSFAENFGAASLGEGLPDAVAFLSKQCESANLKVKKAAYAVIAVFHRHLGAPFQGLVFSSIKDSSLREQVERTFSEHPHDPAVSSSEWAKQSIVTENCGADQANQSSEASRLVFEIPTFDLMSELPADCIARMGSTDGKTSWKARKAALDDLDDVMKRCTGLLDTNKLKPLVDLLRAVRDRLADSQSNLKPVAARLIGVILSATDPASQARLGKVVYAPLINSAMNDSRMIMHDACMEALKIGTSLPKLQGGGPNVQALEPFLLGLVGELDESDFKNLGIARVLDLTVSFSGLLPDLDAIASQGGNTLGGRLAKVLVNGLNSSKVEIRSSSESLMEACLRSGSLNFGTVKKILGRQKPAVQRSLAPIVQRLSPVAVTSAPASNIQPRVDAIETDAKVIERNSEMTPKLPSRAHSSLLASRDVHPASQQVAESSSKASPRPTHRTASVANPLVSNSGPAGEQKSRAAVRSMTWPEYPEEPSGDLILGALKKCWAPLIPPESAKHLFPEGGIKKQDDAMAGSELLSRAIAMESAGEGFALVEQFSFIWKWMTFALCSKESTVGTQALLQLTSDLLVQLRTMKYELSDAEVMVFVPHLFDKASAAKGRFKDTYMDLIELIKAEDLVATKRLGPLVCVAIIESSPYPKARLLACKECQVCVEKIGLSGVGKRGVLAMAKSLSEENLQENRNALVELVSILVLRMNGDIQRFTRICGPSLSGKARTLIEERLKKGVVPAPAVIKPRLSILGTSSLASSDSSKVPRATPSKIPVSMNSSLTPKASPRIQSNTDFDEEIKDELPALDLRLGMRPTPSSNQGIPRTLMNSSTTQNADKRLLDDFGDNIASATEEDRESVRSTLFTSSSNESESSLGAAASLRARLLKIRERNRNGPSATADDNAPNSVPGCLQALAVDTSAAAQGREPRFSARTDLHVEDTEDFPPSDHQAGVTYLDKYLGTIRRLLSKDFPISEDDSELIECTDVLKCIHAAVSQQPGLAVNLDVNGVTRLRDEIKINASEVVETLTRLIAVGFDCHAPACNGCMSVPLLSVNLASLMAIFRSEDVAKTIRVEVLLVLIKEAGKALLDPRLGSSSSTNSLDEATSTQMVRAINKLAVQAAIGSTRHCAFEALMTLQQQLCLKADQYDDQLFNSRLSRVVSKLFMRIVKAEEASPSPFASPSVDLESIICCVEDTLSSCDQAESGIAPDAVAATRNLGIVLVTAVLKAHGGSEKLRAQMKSLGINSESSLGTLVAKIADQMGVKAPDKSNLSREHSSVEVAALVSAVGEASVGPERDAAVSALKAYMTEFGDENLNNHLSHLSPAFRTFVLEQLSDDSKPIDPEKPTSNSMSERIKSLRSKLNATEVVVQSAMQQTSSGSFDTNPAGLDNEGQDIGSPSDPRSAASFSGVRAFRQRLAAARTTSGTEEQTEIPETISTAGSRAAALRARLQAVKRQSEL